MLIYFIIPIVIACYVIYKEGLSLKDIFPGLLCIVFWPIVLFACLVVYLIDEVNWNKKLIHNKFTRDHMAEEKKKAKLIDRDTKEYC